jgi:hypothetical protein
MAVCCQCLAALPHLFPESHRCGEPTYTTAFPPCTHWTTPPRPEYTITERSRLGEKGHVRVVYFTVQRTLRGEVLYCDVAISGHMLSSSYRVVRQQVLEVAGYKFREKDVQKNRLISEIFASAKRIDACEENEQLRAEKRRQYETIQQLQDKVEDQQGIIQRQQETVQTQQATIRVQDAMLAGREREKPVFDTFAGIQFQKRDGKVMYRCPKGPWQPSSSSCYASPEFVLAHRQAQES